MNKIPTFEEWFEWRRNMDEYRNYRVSKKLHPTLIHAQDKPYLVYGRGLFVVTWGPELKNNQIVYVRPSKLGSDTLEVYLDEEDKYPSAQARFVRSIY